VQKEDRRREDVAARRKYETDDQREAKNLSNRLRTANQRHVCMCDHPQPCFHIGYCKGENSATHHGHESL